MCKRLWLETLCVSLGLNALGVAVFERQPKLEGRA